MVRVRFRVYLFCVYFFSTKPTAFFSCITHCYVTGARWHINNFSNFKIHRVSIATAIVKTDYCKTVFISSPSAKV